MPDNWPELLDPVPAWEACAGAVWVPGHDRQECTPLSFFESLSDGVPRGVCPALPHPAQLPGAWPAGASCTESLGHGEPLAVIQPGTWVIGGGFRALPFCGRVLGLWLQ